MKSNLATTPFDPAVKIARTALLTVAIFCASSCGLIMDNEDRLDRSQEAFASGDYRAAIIDAKDVLRDEPDNRRGRLILGRASVEVGDGAAAEKELRRAVQLGVNPLDISGELARSLLMQGKFQQLIDEISVDDLDSVEDRATIGILIGDAYMGLRQSEAAREAYIAAVQILPDDLDARLGIINSHIAEENFYQARSEIEQVIDANPDSSRVWLYSGAFNSQLGDFDAANKNFEMALSIATAESDNIARLDSIAGIAASLIELQKVDLARTFVTQLAEDEPNSLRSKLLIAKVAYADEDWSSAQRELQEILQFAPEYRPAQILLGAVNLRSGNLAQAEMYLSAAVASMPDDVRARQLLAETQIQMRKSDEALDSLAPLISGPDADLISLHMAARASLGNRDSADALSYLRQSLEADPGNTELKLQLAGTLLQVGQSKEALGLLGTLEDGLSEAHGYQRDGLIVLSAMRDGRSDDALLLTRALIQRYEGNADAQNLHGVVLLNRNDVDGARSSFQKAMSINSDNELSQRYLAAIDESSTNGEAAKARYRQAIESNVDALWAHAGLARVSFAAGNYDVAAEHFRIVSEKDPRNLEYRVNWAKSERARGDGKLALSLLEDIVETNPDHIPSVLLVSSIMADAGDVEGATKMATDLLARHPKEAPVHAFLGEIKLAAGDLVGANKLYDNALSLGIVKSHVLRAYAIKRELGEQNANRPLIDYLEKRPQANDVRVVLAESYMQSANLRDSISMYERVVSENPNDAIVLNNLAWGYFMADDPRAVETAQRAYELDSDNGAIVDTLGWIMTKRGSVVDGEKWLRKAAEMEGGRAEVRYHHAVALAKLDRDDEARAILEEILAADDEFSSRSEAAKMLAEL